MLAGAHREQTLFGVIVSGVVKLVKTHHDGRQQIVGLLFAADFVGRPCGESGTLVAQAATDLELCCFARSTFEALMVEYPCVQNAMLRRALDDLDASREWMFLLARKTAREKVASLLAMVAERFALADGGHSAHRINFDLPLSRNEIADALGLRPETISRELRHLNASGVIATRGLRNIVVSDVHVLKAIGEGEHT